MINNNQLLCLYPDQGWFMSYWFPGVGSGSSSVGLGGSQLSDFICASVHHLHDAFYCGGLTTCFDRSCYPFFCLPQYLSLMPCVPSIPILFRWQSDINGFLNSSQLSIMHTDRIPSLPNVSFLTQSGTNTAVFQGRGFAVTKSVEWPIMVRIYQFPAREMGNGPHITSAITHVLHYWHWCKVEDILTFVCSPHIPGIL